MYEGTASATDPQADDYDLFSYEGYPGHVLRSDQPRPRSGATAKTPSGLLFWLTPAPPEVFNSRDLTASRRPSN